MFQQTFLWTTFILLKVILSFRGLVYSGSVIAKTEQCSPGHITTPMPVVSCKQESSACSLDSATTVRLAFNGVQFTSGQKYRAKVTPIKSTQSSGGSVVSSLTSAVKPVVDMTVGASVCREGSPLDRTICTNSQMMDIEIPPGCDTWKNSTGAKIEVLGPNEETIACAIAAGVHGCLIDTNTTN